MENHLTKYIQLITQYVEGCIKSHVFEERYLRLFKDETTSLSEVEYNSLDSLFSAVDVFCDDPDLFEEGDLDEKGLYEEAVVTLKALTQINGKRN